MTSMTCEERRDLILLHTAGGMEEASSQELMDHLRTGCTSCTAFLIEAQELQVSLSLSLDPVQPSAQAAERLAERIRESAIEERPDSAPLRSEPAVQSLSRPSIAALAMAAGIIIGLLLMRDPVDPQIETEAAAPQVQSAELTEELAEVTEELDEAYEELADIEAKFRTLEDELALVRAPSTVSLALHGTDVQPDAVARVFWDAAYSCYLRVENLDSAATGYKYALWVDTTEGGTILAGTFVPSDRGDATLWVPLDSELGTFTRAFVTAEREGEDASAPSREIVLEGVVPDLG